MDFETAMQHIGSGDPARWPTIQQLMRAYTKHVLVSTNNQKTSAAKILGINRRTLYRSKYSVAGIP